MNRHVCFSLDYKIKLKRFVNKSHSLLHQRWFERQGAMSDHFALAITLAIQTLDSAAEMSIDDETRPHQLPIPILR